ncbi:hypothetical protein BGZ65_008670, partial [Modicella reniformis]
SVSKSASAKTAATRPIPAASPSNKRKATAPAAKETPAKKIAVTPIKKETRTAPAIRKPITTAVTKKGAKKVTTENRVAEKKKAVEVKEEEEEEEEKKKPIEKKIAEKKTVVKKTPAPKKTAVATPRPRAARVPAKKEEAKQQEEEEEEEEDEEEGDDQQLMDDRALLKDIDSSADEDSSDDETEEDKAAMKEDSFANMKDEISLNTKAAATLREKLGGIGEPKDKNTTGVVYLGRIPHGFYEDQMQAYFSQFGKVLRLRLSRNKKTGKSKHYAFIEFASQEVANIVADTMNNYLLFGHLLKCKSLQSSQIHPAMFHGANKKFKAIPWLKISKEKHNGEKSQSQRKQIKKKLLRNEDAKRARLAELGIDYDFPGYKASVQEKPKHTKFE